MRGDISKYLFIDSNVNDGRVSLPPTFSCVGNESMSLTLIDFALRRKFYDINKTNNTFYILDRLSSTFYEIEIPEGDYTQAELTNAINSTLTKVISVTSLTNKVASITSALTAAGKKRVFTFSMQSGYAIDEFEIRCYFIKSGNLPIGVSAQGAHSDCFEILGGRPLRSSGDNFSSLVIDIANGTFTGLLPSSTTTMDSLYLRSNVEMGNFESPDLGNHIGDHQLLPSNILARIPVEIDFKFSGETGNDVYQKTIPLKNLEHLHIFCTDKRGRSLADYNPSKGEAPISFSVTLRWDKFIPPAPPTHGEIPSGFPKLPIQPTYGYGMPRI